MTQSIVILFVVLFSINSYGQCGGPPTINFANNTIDICPGESGTNTATVIGAVGSVNYNWSATSSVTNTITASPDITTWYYLEITDDCFTVLDSFLMDVHDVVITSIITTDATNCPGQPGTLGTIEVLPGDPVYTYTLIGAGNEVGPQPSNDFMNLAGGITYFIHVEDSEGCSKDTAVHIALSTNAVNATFDISSLQGVTCFGDSDGAAAIANINGGINPPFEVLWTNVSGVYDQASVGAGGGDAINDLSGGAWVVSVIDDEGCAWSELFEISEPAEIGIYLEAHSPTCYGFNDGSIEGLITGGNGGNSVVITNVNGTQVNFGNIPEVNILGSGWYYMTVTDINGCTAQDSIFVPEPGELNIDLTLTHPFCFNDHTGMAVVDTIYNFAGNYSTIGYYWNPNPSGANGWGQDTCENLGPGDYTLTINDQNGCSLVTDFTITSTNPEMYFIELGSEPWSDTMDGVVYASVGGGTAPYIITWTNLSNMDTETNSVWAMLLPGDYAVEVMDANGCALNDTITVGYLGNKEMTEEMVKIFPTLVYDGLLNCTNSFSNEVLFTVYNLHGEIVFVSELPSEMTQVKLDVASGSYLYRITNAEADSEVQSGRLVVVSE